MFSLASRHASDTLTFSLNISTGIAIRSCDTYVIVHSCNKRSHYLPKTVLKKASLLFRCLVNIAYGIYFANTRKFIFFCLEPETPYTICIFIKKNWKPVYLKIILNDIRVPCIEGSSIGQIYIAKRKWK